MLNLILAPFQFPFMVNAITVSMVVAVPCALLSVFLVLKGWALMGDAMSHAVFPGVVLAYIIGIPFAIGAFIAGLLCAVTTGFLDDNSRLKRDTIMGIVFSGMFGAGLVLYVAIQSDVHLDHILFGDMLGISLRDIGQTTAIALVIALIIGLKWRDFLLHAFDPTQAKASGLRGGLLHYGMLCMIALTIVAALWPSARWRRLASRLPLLLAVPHLALATAALLLFAEGGWIWQRLPFLTPPVDRYGIGLGLTMALKESAFVLWVIYGLLGEKRLADQATALKSLGYGRWQCLRWLVLPALLPALGMVLLAAAAWSLSTVDVALVLGPGNPPTLAVLAWQWLSQGDDLQQAKGALASLLLLAILWLLYRTRYGMAIRAVAFDVNTVRLMGIDANRIISLVFALGSSLAALGGVFYSISYPTIDPLMGVLIGLKAFAAAVLGGIGSVTGAVLGGFILGFTEVVAVAIFPELGGYKDAFAFLFLILVLLFRPVGIMGDERLERSRF